MPPKRGPHHQHQQPPSPSPTTTTTQSKPPSSISSSSSHNRAPTSISSSSPPTSTTPKQAFPSPSTPQQTLQHIYRSYVSRTPTRTKLLDAFLAYLVAQGVLQFVYCVLGGGYPFNAFLAGFVACVGQFVLTVSLRIQTDEVSSTTAAAAAAATYDERLGKRTKSASGAGSGSGNGTSVSNERAFADYIFCSLLLHFFCVNFIN